MTNIAVIGCGYWGPNFVRVFTNLPDSEVKYCCDLSEERLGKMKMLYPHITTTTSLDDVANDPEERDDLLRSELELAERLDRVLIHFLQGQVAYYDNRMWESGRYVAALP